MAHNSARTNETPFTPVPKFCQFERFPPTEDGMLGRRILHSERYSSRNTNNRMLSASVGARPPVMVNRGPEDEWDDVADELPYINMLNRVLPEDIRVLAWCPQPPEDFSVQLP